MNKITTVNAIILNDKKELLLVRKNKYFILPGGKPEPQETNFEALSRELDEETGLKLISAKEFIVNTCSFLLFIVFTICQELLILEFQAKLLRRNSN